MTSIARFDLATCYGVTVANVADVAEMRVLSAGGRQPLPVRERHWRPMRPRR